MRIVVAGGTGFLGRALVERLRSDGHQVAVLTRRARREGEIAWAPPAETGAWPLAVQGADAVINLAGEPIADRRWTPQRKQAILDSRVAATRALASAIAEAPRPPACFLSSSAIGIYGARGSEPVTEDAPPGDDFLATVCRAWEEEAVRASPVTRVVLLRTGLVLDRTGGALPQLALPFRFFAGGPLGSGRQYMSWIHVDDWVGIVRWALQPGNAVAGPLNLTAPAPVTNAEMARALGRVLHRPALLPAPAFALRVALGEMADAMILGGQRVLPAKAEAAGYEFQYRHLAGALSAVYDEPRRHGRTEP